MKYLKKYRLFESKSDIDSICKEYGIKRYKINPDEQLMLMGMWIYQIGN